MSTQNSESKSEFQPNPKAFKGKIILMHTNKSLYISQYIYSFQQMNN